MHCLLSTCHFLLILIPFEEPGSTPNGGSWQLNALWRAGSVKNVNKLIMGGAYFDAAKVANAIESSWDTSWVTPGSHWPYGSLLEP